MISLDYFFYSHYPTQRLLRFINKIRLDFHWKRELSNIDSSPKHLCHYERKVFSQNGEDGIIEEIFDRIGTTNSYFVEFGIEDGQETNTRYLLEKKNWQGSYIEGDTVAANKARTLLGNSSIQIAQSFITKENINDLFSQLLVPQEFDLLSIDIDGNDAHIWEAIAHNYSPRVVCIEYNASYPPNKHWIMPYKKNHIWDGTRYYGASLTALSKISSSHNYSLVACNRRGINAFFVRNDCLGDHFINPGNVSFHYMSPKFNGVFFGHPSGKGHWIRDNTPNLNKHSSQ